MIQGKHPKGLYTLFFTEMWERFSYYGMRALLVLYLSATFIEGGFALSREEALVIYGIFTALVYVTPIFGGILADKLLGQQKAIYIGAIIMAIGQFSMAYSVIAAPQSRPFVLQIALALIIIGNGFFKPNISTILGALYHNNEANKDGGFTLFYMGINLGAFIAPLTAGLLGEVYGWQYGFMSAGVGMLVALLWFHLRVFSLEGAGLPPLTRSQHQKQRLLKRDYIGIGIYALVSIIVALLAVYLLHIIATPLIHDFLILLTLVTLAGVGYLIYQHTHSKKSLQRIIVIFVLSLFNIVFWSGFEQAGGTFNLFALEQTNRMVGSWEIPASWFQSINAIAIFALAPLFDILWRTLGRWDANPSTPLKFAFALVMLAVGFLLMSFAATLSTTALVSPFWLMGVYLLHTIAELMISPIGLSMITKLAPPAIVSVMMGLWMASIAMGNYLAATMERIAEHFGYAQGAEMFSFIAYEAFAFAFVALLLTPWIKKMMHGIH